MLDTKFATDRGGGQTASGITLGLKLFFSHPYYVINFFPESKGTFSPVKYRALAGAYRAYIA